MPLKTRWRGLHIKIIAWSFIPATIILATVAWVILTAYQQVTEDLIIERDREYTRLSAAQLSAELTEYTSLLREHAGLLADSTRPTYIEESDLTALRTTLTEARGRFEIFDGGVLVIDNQGTVIATEPERPSTLGDNWSDRAYFRQMLRAPETVFSNIVNDGPDETAVIVVAVPITGPQGQFLGLIAGLFCLDSTIGRSFYNIINDLRLENSGNTFLVDGNGRVIYHTIPNQIGSDYTDQAIVQQLLNKQTNAIRTQNQDNQEIVASFAPVPDTPWGLVTEESWDTLIFGSRRYGQFLLLLLTLGIIIPALVVATGVRKITKPIAQFITAAQEIAEGNLSQTINLNSNDEIEDLAHQFNRMSAHLQKSYAYLEQQLTERMDAEEALRQSEAKFRSLFEDVPIALLEQDFSAVKTYLDDLRQQGIEDFAAYFEKHPEAVTHCATLVKIHNANKAALTLYQARSIDDLLVELSHYFAEETYNTFKGELIAFAAGQTQFEAETINRTKTGDQVHIHVKLSVAPGHEKTLAKVLLSITDITEHKLTQKSLRRFAERLTTLHAIDRSILSAQSLSETAQDALGYITPLLSCLRTSVTLFDFERQEAIPLATYTNNLSQITTDIRIPLEVFGIDEKLRQGQVHMIPDLLSLSQPLPIVQILRDEGVRSYINVPLIAQEELIGSLNLGLEKPDVFALEHIDIAREVADQLAVAIQQARLYEAIQRQTEELEHRVAERTAELQEALYRTEALYRAGRSLINFDNLPTLLQSIVDGIAETLPANRATLITFDQKEHQITHLVKGGVGANHVIRISFDELWQGLGGWALREQKPALSPKGVPDPRESRAAQKRRLETESGSIIVVPLLFDGQPLGTMTAVNKPDERDFTEQDADLMMALANQAAAAIKNTRLSEERIQQAEEMTVLYEVGRDLVAAIELKTLLPVIVQRLTNILRADRCAIFLFDEQAGMLQARSAYGYMAERLNNFSYKPGEEIVGQAFAENKIQYVPDLSLIPNLPRRDDIKTVLAVPMTSLTAGVVGVLSLSSLKSEAFALEQRQLLETMAGQIAVAIENARLYEAAQEADQLKSAFLASMSHELRTPLNSIIGFTGIILQGLAGPLSAEQTKQLGMIRDSARHLLALINDVLDVSKIESGQLEVANEPMNLPQAIEKVVRTVMPLAEMKGLSLTADIAPEVGEVVSDQRRVEQILINLTNNAIKFTEQGNVHIECRAEDGYIATRVTDTGIGIKSEDLTKLFKPFRQIDTGTARVKEGTGLGLSICKKLVERLGGTMWVESEWNKGSVFTFTLPLQ